MTVLQLGEGEKENGRGGKGRGDVLLYTRVELLASCWELKQSLQATRLGLQVTADNHSSKAQPLNPTLSMVLHQPATKQCGKDS